MTNQSRGWKLTMAIIAAILIAFGLYVAAKNHSNYKETQRARGEVEAQGEHE